ncbi:MAG TPA: hypothetical protein VKZ59_14895 [Acidobacteriota bacterium]|nr:hypothetical protein [Acidobacteriota bacterium]
MRVWSAFYVHRIEPPRDVIIIVLFIIMGLVANAPEKGGLAVHAIARLQ